MNQEKMINLINNHKNNIKSYENNKVSSNKYYGDRIKDLEKKLENEKRSLTKDLLEILEKIAIEKFYIEQIEEKLKVIKQIEQEQQEEEEDCLQELIKDKLSKEKVFYFKGCDNCNEWDGI